MLEQKANGSYYIKVIRTSFIFLTTTFVGLGPLHTIIMYDSSLLNAAAA